MNIWRRLVCYGILLVGASGSVQAQFFSECESGSKSELVKNILEHEEHMSRLNKKLITGRYWQGSLSESFQPVGLTDVHSSLAQMTPRKAAVLFYAYSDKTNKLCIWLITATGPEVSEVLPLKSTDELLSLRWEVMTALDVTTRSLPVRKGKMSKKAFDQQMAAIDRELATLGVKSGTQPQLATLGKTLLPEKIVEAIGKKMIDTLIVMPVFDLGVIPFAALPISKDRMLIDAVSIIVAPGFFVFREEQQPAKRSYAGALVVGNPYSEDPEWHLARLPGANTEAMQIGHMAGVKPLVGPLASRKSILSRLGKKPYPPLIYFAAHGIADDEHPLDGGFLVLSDGRWTGSEIVEQVPRDQGRPLVVLSACQTGLGKNFDVGTIGLARAWHEVGASNVVMSLWRIGDQTTKLLMARFMRHAQEVPPDKALRQAMLERRLEDSRVAAWASFAVFGAPER